MNEEYDYARVTPSSSTRSARESVDELVRELHVRQRCFPRWVAEGKLSRTDGIDRIERLASAIKLLVQGGSTPSGEVADGE